MFVHSLIHAFYSIPVFFFSGAPRLFVVSDLLSVLVINPGDYVLLQDFGTTAVICVYFPATKSLVVANCGDSDAVVGRRVAQASPSSTSSSSSTSSRCSDLEHTVITVSDNVSANKKDVHRILQSHPKKTKFMNGYLSPNHRVYGFHSLAMTRALGHKFLGKYGVIHEPHIAHYEVSENDLVLVVGSDGLWDVVEKEDVFSVATAQGIAAQSACKKLIEVALKSWKNYTLASSGETSSGASADNTTVVVLDLTKTN